MHAALLVVVHLQVEVFTRVLLEQSWTLEMLELWQRHLRTKTGELWLPRRLWFEVIHSISLRADNPEAARAAVARLRKTMQV